MSGSAYINLGNPREYRLLNGQRLDLMTLVEYERGAHGIADLIFLIYLYQQAIQNRPYRDLRVLIAGPGAYPLKGNERVTTEVHNSLLYLIAEDIVDRVGIAQGAIARNPTDVT